MSSPRLVIFVIISLLLHAAILSAIILLAPAKPDEQARPLLVGVTDRYSDPGTGKGNSLDPAPMREPAPEKKINKPAEKKIVKKTKINKPPEKSEKKETVSSDSVSVSVPAAAKSGPASTDVAETGSMSPEGKGNGTGLGGGGEGFDSSGSGRGTETGYPNYGVNPKPEYPMVAKRHGYEGLVVLNVFVMESGSVGKVEIQKSSGYDVLDNSALEAVRKWTFIPGKKNGRAIASWVVVPIRFNLTSG